MEILNIKELSYKYTKTKVLENINLSIKDNDFLAIIGPNGIGKTTLLRCLQGSMEADGGKVKWSENANIGYCAQDHMHDFEDGKKLFDWMDQWRGEGDDEQEAIDIISTAINNNFK